MGKRVTTITISDDLYEALKQRGNMSAAIDQALRIFLSKERAIESGTWFEEYKTISREIKATYLEGKLKPLTALLFFNRVKALELPPDSSLDDKADHEATKTALLRVAGYKDADYEQLWERYFEEAYSRLTKSVNDKH